MNRFGKKYGFNFNDHYNDKVGVLRAFVKKFKNKGGKKASDVDDRSGKKGIFVKEGANFLNRYWRRFR